MAHVRNGNLMSIVAFHRVLIVAAMAFCALFAGWEIARYQEDGDVGRLVLAVVFGILAAALVAYLALLKRFLGGGKTS
jgi:hypothetical protein